MIKNILPKSEFTRNVLTLMTGTTIAQAIPIAISPILTRLYTPQDFGVFALYISAASLLSVIATGRYELAIMLPKKDEDAINIIAISIMIAFFVSFISFLIVFIFNAQITNLLGNPEISSWLYFIPITVLLTGIYQSFNYWSNRKKEYKRLATSRVVRSGTTAVSNLGMGFGGLGSGGLILSSVFGQSIATWVLGSRIFKNDLALFKKSVKKLKIFALIKKYTKMPMLNLPNALIDAFRLSGITILIAKYFTVASLGQFSLAWKMLQMPMSLIGSSISQVFFQKIASSKKSELYYLVKQFIVKASLLILPVFIIIYFYSVDIFLFVFGKEWALAGKIASTLSPWIFINFITSPLSQIFIILNKQEILFLFSIFYMSIPLSIIYIGREENFLNVLEYVADSMSLMLLIFITILLFVLRKKLK